MRNYLLDCTFRDGGYYNNWNYSEDTFKKYLKFVSKNNFDVIEVGFQFKNKKNYHGNFACANDKFLNKFKFPKNISICVMINCSDFINTNVKKFFPQKKKSKISIIRIAAHIEEIDFAIKIAKTLNQLGYIIYINLMQINLVSNQNLIKTIKKFQKSSKFIEKIYFADSFGNLDNHDVKKLCSIFKNYWSKEFGVHMHDNKGKALSNSVLAMKNGATWVDSTIKGMGRGAGNTQTEQIYKYIKNVKLKKNPSSLFDVFADYKKKYKWGPSKLYSFAAKKNIHPMYVQKIELDNRYSRKYKKSIIKKLATQSARKFDPDLIKSTFDKINIKISNKNLFSNLNFKNKEVLILGQGKINKKERNKIYDFIKINNPIVISLNYSKKISQNIINYFVISNEERAILDQQYYSKIKKTIITNRLIYKNFLSNKQKAFIYDLNISGKDKVIVNKNSCRLFSGHVFGYTLALLISKKIFNFITAGIKLNKSNFKEYQRMRRVITNFKSKYSKIKIRDIKTLELKYR